MFGKIFSVFLAAAALAGAVIYAQKKAQERPVERPVFDTSKSGTPTPIDEAPVKKPGKDKAVPKPNEVPTQNKETSPQEKKEAAESKEQKPGKKKKKVMPTSKSYIPD